MLTSRKAGSQKGKGTEAGRFCPPVSCLRILFRDGRFRLGDEIVNVNGKSLRGLNMDEARALLRLSAMNDVDIILAREEGVLPAIPGIAGADILNQSGSCNNNNNNHTPVERRKRRKLPMIERPRSAPIHHQQESRAFSNLMVSISNANVMVGVVSG